MYAIAGLDLLGDSMDVDVSLSTLDGAVVVGYLMMVLAVGLWAGLRQNLEGYWVNARKTRTALLTFTVVAAKIGAGGTIGIAAAAYESGIGFGVVAAVSTSLGFLLTALFSPYIRRFGERHGAYTLSEFFLVRFGRAAQRASAGVIVVVYLSFLASQFVAAAALLSVWSGWSFELALVLTFGSVVLYSAVAGLRGSIATDAVHFWMMGVVFFVLLLPILVTRHPPGDWIYEIPRSFWSPVAFGGWAFLLGGGVFGAVTAVVSMELWMRIYAAVGEVQARRTFIWSAVLVLPFFAAALCFGLAAHALVPGLANPDDALFALVIRLLSPGTLGLGIAAILAVLLSTANTMLLVASATLFRDVLPRALRFGDAGALRLSRLLSLSIGTTGVLLALAVPDVVQLVLNAYFVVAVLAPALFAGLLWRRVTQRAAACSIAGGALTTLGFLPLAPRQAFVPGLLVSLLLIVVLSLFTRHAPGEQEDLLRSLQSGREG